MSLFANTPTKVIILGLGLIFLVWVLLYMGNLAWRHPNKLREKYLVDIAGYPKWFPFRKIDLSHGYSNRYVWSVRISTLLGTLMILVLVFLIVFGILGIIK